MTTRKMTLAAAELQQGMERILDIKKVGTLLLFSVYSV